MPFSLFRALQEESGSGTVGWTTAMDPQAEVSQLRSSASDPVLDKNQCAPYALFHRRRCNETFKILVRELS